MPIVKAYELIEQGWTKEVLARDAQGNSCNPTSPAAKCWCTIGAIFASYRNEPELRREVKKKLHKKINEGRVHVWSIMEWNDAYFQEKNVVYNTLKELDI